MRAPWPCWERPVSSRPYAWQHRLIGTGHNGLWNGGVAHPYPVVGLHFTSKPFRLFYAYESATRSPIISRSSLLSPSRSPPLLPSVVLLSLLLFREWISRSVSPFSKRIGYAPVSVERKDFSLFLDLIFFANDGRGSDGFIDTLFSLEGEGRICIVKSWRKRTLRFVRIYIVERTASTGNCFDRCGPRFLSRCKRFLCHRKNSYHTLVTEYSQATIAITTMRSAMLLPLFLLDRRVFLSAWPPLSVVSAQFRLGSEMGKQ